MPGGLCSFIAPEFSCCVIVEIPAKRRRFSPRITIERKEIGRLHALITKRTRPSRFRS